MGSSRRDLKILAPAKAASLDTSTRAPQPNSRCPESHFRDGCSRLVFWDNIRDANVTRTPDGHISSFRRRLHGCPSRQHSLPASECPRTCACAAWHDSRNAAKRHTSTDGECPTCTVPLPRKWDWPQGLAVWGSWVFLLRGQDGGMFEGFEQRHIDVGSCSLFVRYGGEGPPVLLLHGHPRTSATWHRVVPQLLNAGFSVVCPDLPGYGQYWKRIPPYERFQTGPRTEKRTGTRVFSVCNRPAICIAF